MIDAVPRGIACGRMATGRRDVLARLLAAALSWLFALPSLAADSPSPDVGHPPAVTQLLHLLSEPEVRDWLQRQQTQALAQEAGGSSPALTPSAWMAGRISTVREHLDQLSRTLPVLPGELDRARQVLLLEFEEQGLRSVLLLLVGFIALGFGTQWAYRRAAAGWARWIVTVALDTVKQRLRAMVIRLTYATGLLLSFALGSVGAFLALDWPPLLREIVLGYLLAALVAMFAMVLGRFVLAPGGERFRICPMSTPAAWFWYWRLGLFVGVLAFGRATIDLLAILGVSPASVRLLDYGVGLLLLLVGIEASWRRPIEARPAPTSREPAIVPDAATPTDAVEASPAPEATDAALPIPRSLDDTDSTRLLRSHGLSALVSAYLVFLWMLWVAGAIPAFGLALVLVGLPLTVRVVQRSVAHMLRPPGTAEATAGTPQVTVVLIERGVRAVLIIAAALLLATIWDLDLVELTARDTLATRLLRGALNAVVIVLIADFIWYAIKAAIDQRIGGAQTPAELHTEEGRRRARLRTLLPIARNLIFVVLVTMAVLMVLSAMGFEIGPLVAGAGVIGVAIGFGAQTLVKDIISGVFYLLDDAFRVGEYVQSGSYKGTVESFSLRSVKLRHHRGPLYTVPFGELGAVQNMSRDWVIDKLTIGVTYDTDLALAKKLIKRVGAELLADEEIGPNLLETLKMQGVEAFGDFAIQIRMKMMTKPGEQFTARRRAFARIKQLFDENGVKFAFPVVQVAGGGGHDDSAVAQHELHRMRAATESAGDAK